MSNTPSLHDANRVLHKDGLIGEDKNVLTAFIAFVFSREFVCLRGFSGSGKTVMGDAVYDLLPEHTKTTFQMGSEKAVWYDDELQNANFVYVTEYQKASENLDFRELFKMWGEGKPFKRQKTVSGEGSDHEVETTKLTPRPILTTLADENDDAEIDDEAGRRTIMLYADPSKSQTQKVIDSKADEFSQPWQAETVSEEVVRAVQSRVSTSSRRANLKDVAMPGFDEAFADSLPMEFHDTRSVIEHFFNVISGVARFYGDQRATYEGNLLATPRDLFESFEIYKETLLNNCLRLENLGSTVLGVFPMVAEDDHYDENAMLSASEVMRELKHQGIMLPKNKVRSILAKLCMVGYLEEDETFRPPKYMRAGLAKNPDDLIVDWGEVINVCKNQARDVLPESFAEEHVEVINENLRFDHPVTGETILLSDYDGSTDPTQEEADVVKSETKQTSEQHRSFDDLGFE